MSVPNFLETRCLKRPRLGPPDVYPQSQRQKEDELTSVNVKQGFNNQPPFSDECASAHQYSIDPNKISQCFSSILMQKQIINTFNDAGKKRPQVTKENFTLIAVINGKTRSFLQNWFKDLKTRPLTHLSRKVPVLTKKEDIFQGLADHEVPLVRATWFIKMTAAFHLTQTDAKVKKRASNDPNSDWTQAICKFLREQLNKLNEENSKRSNGVPLSSDISSTVSSVGIGSLMYPTNLSREDLEKQLQYISNLAHHMYTEGLLDRYEFLTWFVDVFESIPLYDEIFLSYFMVFVQQYVEEVVMNQILARRMSFAAARHLNWIFSGSSSRSGSPSVQSGQVDRVTTPGSASQNRPFSLQPQLQHHCPPHLQSIAYTLACAVQCTAIICPGALVWHIPADPKACGSPLDLLPCAPSDLLLPDIAKDDVAEQKRDAAVRNSIREREREIVLRSRAAEMRWSSDKCQESTTGRTINRVLSALEALDKQNFDRFDPLELLYRKIFEQPHGKDMDVQISESSEDAVISLLCEWAITPKRLGEHRAGVVAKLLDMRQIYYEQEQQEQLSNASANLVNPAVKQEVTQSDQSLPTDAESPPNTTIRTTPYFQNLLFNFLDTQAPELKDAEDAEQVQSFKNLVLLFAELIEHDVFSHDHYVNMLISRGDVSSGQNTAQTMFNDQNPSVNNSASSGDAANNSNGAGMNNMADSSFSLPAKMEINDVDFSNPSESVFSPDGKPERHFLDAVRTIENDSGVSKSQNNNSKNSGKGNSNSVWGPNQSRHMQYLLHFPIPFQDDAATNEWNQRLMVLYGAGRQKTQIKRSIRKVTRHLVKLIQNKKEIDEKTDNTPQTGWGVESKKSKQLSKSSHSELLAKHRTLSYFDQYMATSTAAKALLASLNNFIASRSSSLPNLQVVVLLFDLMEEALNVGGLVQTAVSICTCLAPLYIAIKRKQADDGSMQSDLSWYSTKLSLNVVAVLRHYQSCLTINTDLMMEAFDGLLALAKLSSLPTPAKCTSADRIILVFLHDLYTFSSSHIRNKYLESFSSYIGAIKLALYSTKKPATSNCRYEPSFMKDLIEHPDIDSAFAVAERYSAQLQDTTCRYSFVCTAIITVCCKLQNFEKVNALAVLCVEMNARCNELSAEWLGVLKALCCSSCTTNFNDVQLVVEASDAQIRDPLALFTAVLIARGCLSLEDIIQHVAIPSLLAACHDKSVSGLNNPDTGARLTCHLLLQLFKAPVPPNSNMKRSFYLPLAADRHLLAAAQRNIADGAVLAVLKGVVKLGDAGPSTGRMMFPSEGDVSVTSFFAPIQGLDDFDDITMTDSSTRHSRGSFMEAASLIDFAKHVVRVICAQQWVRDRCLKDPNIELLMDQFLTPEQRQSLIQLICYPEEDLKKLSSLSSDPRNYVAIILTEMTRWTLRQRLLELEVMLFQSSQERSLSEHIAKATIEVFQQQQMQQSVDLSKDRRSLSEQDVDRFNVWLVAPLISKLSSRMQKRGDVSVQGKVLQEASAILDRDRHERNYGCSSLLNHQPFLTLILTCLKGQDEQRDSLLELLQSQIIMLHSKWQSSRSPRDVGKDPPCFGLTQNGVHDALQLRLSLVGGMFDTVQNNSQYTSNVVLLLTSLINSGMVDVQVNPELFNIVFDMIAVLLHHTLGGDVASRAEGSKREYMNIVKKMKKSMGEQQTEGIRRLRQLLPIPRVDTYVVCCEPVGPLVDVKGNKIPVPVDGNHGLQVASKQKLNVWEIIEGLKNPAPLCLAWFGARKTERKMLYYEKERISLMEHDHGTKRSLDEFLKPPQLPPEEDEVVPPPQSVSRKQSIKPGSSATSTSETKRSNTKPTKAKRASRSRPSKTSEPTLHNKAHPNIGSTIGTSRSMLLNIQQNPSSYGMMGAQHPPNYPMHQQPASISNPYNVNPYQATGGYSTNQQQIPNMKGRRESKQALEQLLQKRSRAQLRPNTMTGGYSMDPVRQSPVRQKLVQKTVMGGPHDMFNPVQGRQPIQQHMINAPSNPSYTNYNSAQKQQGMIQNYNNVYRSNMPPSGQMGYQQSNVGGVQAPQQQQQQQYIGPQQQQQQQQLRSNNYGMTQNTFNNQSQLMNIQRQTQQPAQYNMNQHAGRQAQLARLGGPSLGGGMHQMSNNPSLQQGVTMNQRQMMDQQLMTAQQQYGQPMPTNQQQVGMMDIRRNVMNQPPQY